MRASKLHSYGGTNYHPGGVFMAGAEEETSFKFKEDVNFYINLLTPEMMKEAFGEYGFTVEDIKKEGRRLNVKSD